MLPFAEDIVKSVADRLGPIVNKQVAMLLGVINENVKATQDAVTLLTKLVTLDVGVRRQRSNLTSRPVAYEQLLVSNAQIVALRRVQENLDNTFSSALFWMDAASGAGRWRSDGPDPTTTAAGLGMPIPAGVFQFRLEGIDQLKAFRVIAETATVVNMNITYYD